MLCKSIFSMFLCFFCTAMPSANNLTYRTHNPYDATVISQQDKEFNDPNENSHPNQSISPKSVTITTKSQTYLGRKERFKKLSEIAELEAYRQNRNRK